MPTLAVCRRRLARPSGTSRKLTAANVGGLFFPQTKSLGIDRTELSPQLQRKVVYAGANKSSFAEGSRDLTEYLQLQVDPKQIERVSHRIGLERCAERDAAAAQYLSLPLAQRKDKPEGVEAPQVAVVGVDGGRMQIRDDSWLSHEQQPATATTPAAAAAAAPTASTSDEEALPPDEQHRSKFWREDKVGLLMTMTSEEKQADPCPEIPAVFIDPTRIVKLARELKTKKAASVEESKQELASPSAQPQEDEETLREEGRKMQWQAPEVKDKHLTATRRPWAKFGAQLASLAWSLGFFQAQRKAFLGDGSDHNWTIWRNHFSSFEPILDIIHAISYLFAAATAGRPFQEGWRCYACWAKWLWAGEIEQIIAALAQRQAELGPPQENDGDTHPRVVVEAALRYLQNHKEKMRYPKYRRLGLPITSAYVESAVKQFNQRVKGTEKFWTAEGGEALLQLRSDYLTTTNPLEEFWGKRQNNATGQASYIVAA
jgi:hypothetical protein